MAPLLDALNEIIHPSLNVTRSFALQEANPAGRHPAIELRENKDDCALVLSFEQCHSALQRPCGCLSAWIHPLLRAGLGLRESCDYVAFRETDAALWILLIELKSNHADHARRQIARTRIVADYLIETARHYRSLPRPARNRIQGERACSESRTEVGVHVHLQLLGNARPWADHSTERSVLPSQRILRVTSSG